MRDGFYLILFIVAFICWLAIGAMHPARGQDGHMRYHHFYRTWMVPGTNPPVSCCNAREYFGETPLFGDCEPSEFTVRKGKWFAKLPTAFRHLGDANGEVEVPDAKILHQRNPTGQEGHLCWTPQAGVICAVPPDTGG